MHFLTSMKLGIPPVLFARRVVKRTKSTLFAAGMFLLLELITSPELG